MVAKSSRYYVGVNVKNNKREVFRSVTEPTEKSHGARYSYSIGPFRTKQGAEFMATYGRNNPHCQTVAEAERLAKIYAKK